MNLIQQIHESFDSSLMVLERQLVEIERYNKRIEESKGYDIASKLHSLGFHRAKPVSEAGKKIDKIPTALMSDIRKWREALPLNGLILLSQVYQICETYGLYIGEAGMYKGDIPHKNAIELTEFNKRLGGKIEFDYYICAPLSDFELKDTYLTGAKIHYFKGEKPKFKLLALKEKVPDPVVLCVLSTYGSGEKLMGIVSKWGPEAIHFQNPVEN